jgi:hypothetical protein
VTDDDREDARRPQEVDVAIARSGRPRRERRHLVPHGPGSTSPFGWTRRPAFGDAASMDEAMNATDGPAPSDALATVPPELPAERLRATGPPHEGAPVGIAIGIVSALGFAGLAFLMAFAFFAAVAIYALVKAIGGSEDHGNAVVVVLITVFLLTLFVALLLIGIGKLGGSLSPRKRRRAA